VVIYVNALRKQILYFTFFTLLVLFCYDSMRLCSIYAALITPSSPLSQSFQSFCSVSLPESKSGRSLLLTVLFHLEPSAGSSLIARVSVPSAAVSQSHRAPFLLYK
jgi:hypothetical protein